MKSKANLQSSFFENSGSKGPSTPSKWPPIQTNATEPECTNNRQTHIAGPPSPSSGLGGPAPICTCGLELGCIPPYQIGDEEFDMVIFTKRCEIHEKDKHGDFLEELEDFNQPRLRLTMEGLKMQMRLYREKNSEVEVKIQSKGGHNP